MKMGKAAVDDFSTPIEPTAAVEPVDNQLLVRISTCIHTSQHFLTLKRNLDWRVCGNVDKSLHPRITH